MKSSCSFFALERLFLLFLFFLFFIGSSVFPQTLINGKVTGRHGVPLSGATIAIKATNSFSTSDSAGRFSIKANPGAVIEFSFIGYHDQSLVLGNQTELNILLNETILNLNDVVLIGYGSTQRKDVTGSVAKVTPKEFNTGIITNPLQQLQGKVAGLVIVQPGGDPNGDFIVRLKGATSLEGQPPLLVIDGVALDDFNKAVTTLNPADIETYDILKDASAAAIYGTRGANGVILVTTKKSRAGKTSVEYAGFVGMENISNQVDLLNADQWRQATTNMNATDLDKGANTDWQKAIAQTGFSQSHLIAISGGSDQLNFRGSIGYISQQGVILNSGKNILTARLAADQKSFKNKLTIRYSLNASAINRDFLPDQNSTSQARTGGAFVFGQSLHYLPVWPVYNPDGSYFEPPNINLNPVFLLNELYSKQRENFFQASVNANYEILKGLKAGVLGALSRGNDVYDRFWPAIPGTPLGSEASKSNNNKQNFTGDIHGNYQKSFGKNTIDVTGVYEYNQFINDGFGVTARGFQVPDILNNNLGTATDINTNDIYSYKNEVKLISFLARAIYTYNDRYILTASFRRDGSSKFGPNYRWGNFPSVAVAWRADKENFLKDVKWLNNLKFRVSYGYTGNQENLPPNSYQTFYAPAGPYLNNG